MGRLGKPRTGWEPVHPGAARESAQEGGLTTRLQVNDVPHGQLMTAAVVQINISPGGIPKRRIPEGILTPLGLEGDSHAHPQFHGGPSKAVLLIASEVVDSLIAKGYPVFYGALGENFTTRGLDPKILRSGQRLRVGSAVIELTTVRIPCRTLDVYGPAIKKEIYDKSVGNGDASSPRWALSGFYASVIQVGRVATHDPVLIESTLA